MFDLIIRVLPIPGNFNLEFESCLNIYMISDFIPKKRQNEYLYSLDSHFGKDKFTLE